MRRYRGNRELSERAWREASDLRPSRVALAAVLNPQEYADNRAIFDQSQELVRSTPSAQHPGAELIVFRVRR
jgi:hypothetical protein